MDCIDLSGDLVPTYLAAIPVDPEASDDGSGYLVAINSLNSRVSVQTNLSLSGSIIGINLILWNLLDQYQDAAAAYSLRQLSNTYSGNAVRVRRASDNAEQDIGFVDRELDVASLESFASGTDGFVTTWYDQSGEGRDLTQATAGRQAQIVASGSVITTNGNPAVQFDGTDDGYVSTSGLTGFSTADHFYNFTAFQPTSQSIANTHTKTGTFSIGDYVKYAMVNATILLSGETRTFYPIGINSGGGTARVGTSTYTWSGNQQLLETTYASTTGLQFWSNSSNYTFTLNSVLNQNSNLAPSSTSITDANAIVYIGDYQTTSSGQKLQGKMQESIFYLSDQTANRTAIENNINTYYAIY